MKKEIKTDTATLGGRIKSYEVEYETIVEPEDHLIIRIDGHHFSAFTKDCKKPFDKILSDSMIQATYKAVERFNAYCGYTQSDEITLFIPSLKDLTVDDRRTNKEKQNHKLNVRIRDDWEHQFSGRTQKLASLVAAFITKEFNKAFRINAHAAWDYSDTAEHHKYCAKMDDLMGEAYFDARVFGVPSTEEAFNIFMWRNRDCVKNSKSMFAQAYCSHKELQNKNGEEQIQYCLEKTSKDWNTIEDKFKYGVFVKKELFEKEVDFRDLNYKDRDKFNTSEKQTITRSRLVFISKNISSFSKENLEFVCSQYFNGDK